MNKKGKWALILSIVLLVILILVIFFYFVLFNPRNDKIYTAQAAEGKLVNPVNSLTNEEAIAQFNESFVYYLLYSIKAYNLHNPPLSKSTPKIAIYVDSDEYNAEIVNGAILIKKESIENKDIIIRTTKSEAVKMLKSKDYVKASFESGNSALELIESKSVLFGKGYLNLYTELTGKSVTGNVIRIYAS